MLDVGLTLALLLGIWRAVRARHFVVSALGCVAYLLVMDWANAFAAQRGAGSAFEPFAVLFLGPSAMTDRALGVLPTLVACVAHPLAVRIVVVVVVGCVVAILHGQASRLRPESNRARALDAIASPILFFGVVQAMLVAMGVLVALLLRHTELG
jgi:hypothetical protein